MRFPLALHKKHPRLQAALPALPVCMLAAMALALSLSFSTGRSALGLLGLLGLLGFAALALLRPDDGLLFVPATAPLFILSLTIPHARGTTSPWALHELVLALVLAATLLNGMWRWRSAAWSMLAQRSTHRWMLHWRTGLPYALFLGAGLFGLLLALPDAAAHAAAGREFRRFFVEPLLFYALLRWCMARDARYARRVAIAVAISGALVALLAVLQYAGFENIVALLFNQRLHFADSVLETGTLRRVSSVYGNPNNLGLYLGRVWPLAAVLALIAWKEQRRVAAWLFGGSVLLCLGGIVASFSRGAWLGVAGALAVLAAGLLTRRRSHASRWALVMIGVLAISAAGVVFGLRGVTSGSDAVRLLFWREAWQLIQRHPFGLGLDQFYFYHDPAFGRSLIAESISTTNDKFARHPHNLLLEWWLQAGPLGVLAFGWLLVRFARHARAALHTAPVDAALLVLGASAAMTAALVHGMVDSFYAWPDIALLFWLLIALVEAQVPMAGAARPIAQEDA